MRLESRVLSTDAFKKFSEEAVLFLHLTSQVEGEKDGDLLQRKGGNGFPYLVAMDAGGSVTAQMELQTVDDAELFVTGARATLKKAKEYTDLKAKKDPTVAERVTLLKMDVAVGNATGEDVRIFLAEVKDIEPALRKELESILIDDEVKAALPRSGGREALIAAGAKYAAMWKEGKEPSEEMVESFFIFMLDHAEAVKDVDLFGRALERIRTIIETKYSDNPKALEFLAKQDERFAALKPKEKTE
jgi:hypothetical protein